jgi:hypothetical protein
MVVVYHPVLAAISNLVEISCACCNKQSSSEINSKRPQDLSFETTSDGKRQRINFSSGVSTLIRCGNERVYCIQRFGAAMAGQTWVFGK